MLDVLLKKREFFIKELRRIDEQKDMLFSNCLPKSSLKGIVVQKTTTYYPAENYVNSVLKSDYERELIITELIEIEKEIDIILSKILDYRIRRIVEDKLLHKKSFNDIAKKNNFSKTTASNLYWKGIKEV